MLTASDVASLTLEFYRTSAPDSLRSTIALHLLDSAFRHIGRRRSRAASDARRVLRQAMAEVYAQEVIDYARALERWYEPSTVTMSPKPFRVPIVMETAGTAGQVR